MFRERYFTFSWNAGKFARDGGAVFANTCFRDAVRVGLLLRARRVYWEIRQQNAVENLRFRRGAQRLRRFLARSFVRLTRCRVRDVVRAVRFRSSVLLATLWAKDVTENRKSRVEVSADCDGNPTHHQSQLGALLFLNLPHGRVHDDDHDRSAPRECRHGRAPNSLERLLVAHLLRGPALRGLDLLHRQRL